MSLRATVGETMDGKGESIAVFKSFPRSGVVGLKGDNMRFFQHPCYIHISIFQYQFKMKKALLYSSVLTTIPRHDHFLQFCSQPAFVLCSLPSKISLIESASMRDFLSSSYL